MFILTLREPSVNRKDLRTLTLVGPPRDNPKSDPLAVIHLDNRLLTCFKFYLVALLQARVAGSN